jgi:enoyl-CoA hydratase/carnithine racemase
MIDGAKAFELGLADRLFDSAEFLDESLQFLMDLTAANPVERLPVREPRQADDRPGAPR